MKKFIKLLSIILCFTLCTGVFSVCAFAEDEAEATVLGDVNGDGELTTDDARIVLRMACGIDEEDVSIADVNGDGIVSVSDAIKVLRDATTIGGVVIPDKNGDNFLDDKPNNEFIVLISETYNIPAEALVAIYSVPDSGTNYVLQFKKKLLSDEYNKTTSGLEKVYHIGMAPERKISYTDGALLEGENHHYNCTAAEGWITFNLVKNEVMAQYPAYFK